MKWIVPSFTFTAKVKTCIHGKGHTLQIKKIKKLRKNEEKKKTKKKRMYSETWNSKANLLTFSAYQVLQDTRYKMSLLSLSQHSTSTIQFQRNLFMQLGA